MAFPFIVGRLSDYFKTNAICASENFDAFMELPSSHQGIIIGKFQFELA
jgi:hypothetical protein